MIDRYIFQLKSLDPTLRREAINYLSKTNNPRSVDALRPIAEKDTLPELRTLATAAIEQIERELNFIITVDDSNTQAAPNDDSGPIDNDPLAALMPKKIKIADKDREQAYKHLQMAYSYRAGSEPERGVYELSQALNCNPLLAYERTVRVLASDLMGSGDTSQAAIIVLMQRMASGNMRKPAVPLLDSEAVQWAARIAIASLLLFAICTAMFFGISHNPFSVEVLLSSSRDGFFTVVSILIADLLMFIVVMLFGGNTNVLRFISKMLTAQVPFFTVIFVGTTILPLVGFSTGKSVDGSVYTVMNIRLLTLFAIGALNLTYETFFVWRDAQFTSDKGMLVVMFGTAIFFIVGTLLGIFQNFRII